MFQVTGFAANAFQHGIIPGIAPPEERRGHGRRTKPTYRLPDEPIKIIDLPVERPEVDETPQREARKRDFRSTVDAIEQQIQAQEAFEAKRAEALRMSQLIELAAEYERKRRNQQALALLLSRLH